MKRKNSGLFPVNIGASSLLLVFSVLCLVSFAALSAASADADARLTQKTAAHTAAYYQACGEAQDMLASLDQKFVEAFARADKEQDYFELLEAPSFSFSLPVAERQKLYVTVLPLYPSGPGEPFYEITRWQIVTETP